MGHSSDQDPSAFRRLIVQQERQAWDRRSTGGGVRAGMGAARKSADTALETTGKNEAWNLRVMERHDRF